MCTSKSHIRASLSTDLQLWIVGAKVPRCGDARVIAKSRDAVGAGRAGVGGCADGADVGQANHTIVKILVGEGVRQTQLNAGRRVPAARGQLVKKCKRAGGGSGKEVARRGLRLKDEDLASERKGVSCSSPVKRGRLYF